jgi:hypothetical protein
VRSPIDHCDYFAMPPVLPFVQVLPDLTYSYNDPILGHFRALRIGHRSNRRVGCIKVVLPTVLVATSVALVIRFSWQAVHMALATKMRFAD